MKLTITGGHGNSLEFSRQLWTPVDGVSRGSPLLALKSQSHQLSNT